MIPLAESRQHTAAMQKLLKEKGLTAALFIFPIDVYYYAGTRKTPPFRKYHDPAGLLLSSATATLPNMARVFVFGPLEIELQRVFDLSLEIKDALQKALKPLDASARDLFHRRRPLAEQAGLGKNFMGMPGEQAKVDRAPSRPGIG